MEEPRKLWHNKIEKTVFESFATTANGLSKEEVISRFAEYGLKQISEPRRHSLLLRFFCQFHNVIIYVLITLVNGLLPFIIALPLILLLGVFPGCITGALRLRSGIQALLVAVETTVLIYLFTGHQDVTA